MDDSEALARRDYRQALRRAFWRRLKQGVGHRCNDLVPAGDIFRHLSLENRRHLGLQEVPLERIVGSAGRHHDFDLAFLPRAQVTADRWLNIAQARYRGVELPPPTLYKVGDAFFVEDGNHRVSVARARGQGTIEALVVEIDSSALRPEPRCTRLGFKADGDCGC